MENHGATIEKVTGVSPFQRVSNIALSAWSGFLWRQVRPSTYSRSGLPLTLRSLSDWDVFSEIWVSGEYDGPIQRTLEQASAHGPVRIVDLGANVGLFSLRCMELRNSHDPQQSLEIVAVEAVPRIFQILERNLRAREGNPASRNVSVSLHQGLVGKKSGMGQIYDQSYGCANAVVPANAKTSILPFRGAHAVPSAYLDLESILPPKAPIDLLKCDIEGSESVFLASYPEILSRTRLLAIEFHPLHCQVEECRQMVTASGFELDGILRNGPTAVLETYRNHRAVPVPLSLGAGVTY
jgi:FkbM family methyltransferase